jgi:hypothetical protein
VNVERIVLPGVLPGRTRGRRAATGRDGLLKIDCTRCAVDWAVAQTYGACGWQGGRFVVWRCGAQAISCVSWAARAFEKAVRGWQMAS